ncbi:MAG: glycosyltransferase family 2 protein [Armatimonadota bacterium]
MSRQARPFVSLIIPARNEGRYIAGCLHSLLCNDYPVDRWEIIIADGISTDNTREEIALITREAPIPITVVDNPRQVVPSGLNLAINRARGSIIIRIDAHAEYPKNYITCCVDVSTEFGGENVGGPITTLPGADTQMARAIAAGTTHPFGVGNSAFRTTREAREVDTVPFGCFRAEVFKRLGLFDERLIRNQDYEMNQRIRRAGGHIYLDPRIQSNYYNRATLGGLLQQAWANGFWNALTHYLHPYSLCPRHALPGLFTVGLLATAITTGIAASRQLPTWLFPLIAALWLLFILYGLLNLWVSTILARRHGWTLWPCLLILFPTFHFIYGAGYTWGWTRALLHWHPWQSGDGIPIRKEQPEYVTQHTT